MSKSRGNVIAPDDLVSAYGADTVRAFLMFFARWDQGGPWNGSGIDGTSRWLRRVWSTILDETGPGTLVEGSPDPEIARGLRRKVHQTLRSISHDSETFEFNTIVSGLMELLNEMIKARQAGVAGTPAWNEAVDIYLRMLAPVTPHIVEEMWERTGRRYSIHTQSWPAVDEDAARAEEITLVVQVNGKLRDRITVPADISEEQAKQAALASEAVQRHLSGREPRQVIYIPGRLVNLVG
jgi:leucyl-tRNA synthetase